MSAMIKSDSMLVCLNVAQIGQLSIMRCVISKFEVAQAD